MATQVKYEILQPLNLINLGCLIRLPTYRICCITPGQHPGLLVHQALLLVHKSFPGLLFSGLGKKSFAIFATFPVKFWHTKSRFCSLRTLSARLTVAHSHTFRPRGSWANVHVGKQFRAQKLSEFMSDEQIGFQFSKYKISLANLVLQKQFYQSRNVSNSFLGS